MLGTGAAAAYVAARKLGIEARLRDSRWRSRRLLILCWHGISLEDEHEWRPGLYISPAVFRQRLQALQDGGYRVLPFEDAVRRLQAGDLPPRSAAITFDDGFYDFAALAAPVLAEFSYPATVYLTTYYVDRQIPIWTLIVSYLLWKGGQKGRSLEGGEPLATAEQRGTACARLFEQADRDGATGEDRNTMARALAAELGVDYDEVCRKRLLHLMTAPEVSALAAGGLITFDAHTHRHRTPPELDLIARELRDNNNRIEQITGRRPRHFCYPSGVYRREYFPVLQAEGFESATTCHNGMASTSNHRYLLPRLLDHSNLKQVQYESWLSGFRALFERP